MAIIAGTDGPDVLNGTDDADEIYGYNGNDRLNGGSGDDDLRGGGSSDILDGGDGADILRGGSFSDRYLNVRPDDRVIEYEAGGGDDTIEAFGWDVHLPTYVENLILGGTNVTGWGNAADNTMVSNSEGGGALYGRGGDDVLTASHAGVTLYGGSGNDSLNTTGMGTMYGDSGRDYMVLRDDGDIASGGAGKDEFLVVFGSVTGFGTGSRQITDLDARFEMIDIIDFSQTIPMWGDRISPASFHAGQGPEAVAQTEAHRFIWDRLTGHLYYDTDGVGGETQVRIAIVHTVNGDLSARNIYVQEFD